MVFPGEGGGHTSSPRPGFTVPLPRRYSPPHLSEMDKRLLTRFFVDPPVHVSSIQEFCRVSMGHAMYGPAHLSAWHVYSVAKRVQSLLSLTECLIKAWTWLLCVSLNCFHQNFELWVKNQCLKESESVSWCRALDGEEEDGCIVLTDVEQAFGDDLVPRAP